MWTGGMLYFLAQVCEERASGGWRSVPHILEIAMCVPSACHQLYTSGWILTVILSLLPFPSSLYYTPSCFIFSFCHPLPFLSHTLFCFLPVFLKVGLFPFSHPVPRAPFLIFFFAHCLFLLFINPRGLLSVLTSYPT